MADHGELRTMAEDLATEAGALVLDRLGSLMETDTKSSSADLVTEVDRAAEALIVERILAARPNDSIVGEEGTGISGSSDIAWVIDPIDGTTNFVYNYPGFGVSVAVQQDGTTVAGAVIDLLHNSPNPDGVIATTGDLYSAAHGQGASRNGEHISASGASDLAVALVATGFSFLSERRARQAQALVTILPQVRDIRRQGSAAVDLCSVACGRVDAYFEHALNEWDLAAGALIAQEAGAVVRITDVNGVPFTVASAPGIAAALDDVLEQAGAAQV